MKARFKNRKRYCSKAKYSRFARYSFVRIDYANSYLLNMKSKKSDIYKKFRLDSLKTLSIVRYGIKSNVYLYDIDKS